MFRSGRNRGFENPEFAGRCSSAPRRLHNTMSSRNGSPAELRRRSKLQARPGPGTAPDVGISKLGERPEFVEAGVDFRARQRAEPVYAELFATEAAHHRPINDGAAEF